MAAPKKTLYEILGVERDANGMDIGLAHQRRTAELRRAAAPDPSATALLQQAFEVLSDEKRRAAYDAQLLTAAERSAAAEQATPDLEIEAEEPKKKPPWVPIGIVAALALVALFIALRPSKAPAPPPPPPQAEAPKPPPPRPRTGSEILGSATPTVGQVMVYSMSGAATPIGLAVAIDRGTMVTTCHGIPAGGKLVVKVGKEQHPADLTITDEALDLCRLAVDGYTTPPAKVAADPPREGDKVYTVAPDGKGELGVAEGTAKGLRKETLLEITTPVAANASGAAVFDAFGNLVGIATTPHDHGPGVHVAIPASAIAQMRSRTK